MKNFLVFTTGSVAGFIALPITLIYVPVIRDAMIKKCVRLAVSTMSDDDITKAAKDIRAKMTEFIDKFPEDVK